MFKGLLRGSLIPEKKIRKLRTYWKGLRPRNDESVGKYKSTATTKGNRYLRAILVQVAWAASQTKGTFFKENFTRLSIRKSKKKSINCYCKENKLW